MSSLEYVDLATARAARGTRIVTSAIVASPWSEAVKGIFNVMNLPALVTARGRDATDVIAWTGIDNVPIVLHDDDPIRTSWAAIVGLAARLAGPDRVVPTEPAQRAEVMGLLELIAGENGLGWNARLAMIATSFEHEGKRGFTLGIASYLAKRYGWTPAVTANDLRERVALQLRVLDRHLAAEYFGGARPSALDVYAATFLTALTQLDDTTCPQMHAASRAAFGTAAELLADLVPAKLWTHRSMMFERHLELPIRLA
ncbi:MAG TPA: hypothetical protein VIV40_01065 [Kofleriaceae bacterium]